ncbi:hypothetical protein [Mucilaginibacter myungsuensis]|uniref:Uncharacterized protein n=1 Tax=Mucilaginibacter myungsuensis TaxID=649104 RepID=A0A929L054_9SPHI|nr:hypothetical protein [Mucilaginibacter myungsuensis]MBE9664392.1 hypothetical protein [Mucilaginibacter myungsuensis]MDN3597104.1 hypothetical protein [Mucilaginibacter myungsuensis]
MVYYKRKWDELRGDEQDHWGTSIWYFEVGDDDYPTRQIEVYEHGPKLKYDVINLEDSYGGLSEVALDKDEFKDHLITKEQFESVWTDK